MKKHSNSHPRAFSDTEKEQKKSLLGQKRQRCESRDGDKLMDLCRSQEGGKRLYVHAETLTCCLSGCVACAYKIVVQPHGCEDAINSGGSGSPKGSDKTTRQYLPNVRPEECLRKISLNSPYSALGSSRSHLVPESRWAGLYGCQDRILILGDGNMTFALSLAKQLKQK